MSILGEDVSMPSVNTLETFQKWVAMNYSENGRRALSRQSLCLGGTCFQIPVRNQQLSANYCCPQIHDIPLSLRSFNHLFI